MNKNLKDCIVIGFALFAMFFGAGNLIFPPYLGKLFGTNWSIAIIGFLITGVGLPLSGIIASAKLSAGIEAMAGKINKKFALIMTTALIITLGPLVAIPRTAATTFELSVKPYMPNVDSLIPIVIYMLINLAFVIKPSSIIDTIGKFLTPALLALLTFIIVKGIISPIAPVEPTTTADVFSTSLLQGYQTMDALGSVIFASIIISSAMAKGYTKKEDIMKVTIKSGIIAVGGLGFVYGGLMYLGAQTVTAFPDGLALTELVTRISKSVAGSFGSAALSGAVALACLTTSIGLTATAAEFFDRVTNGKLSYKLNSIIITIVSIFLAKMGVGSIIKFAGPILGILYPPIITLIFLTLASKIVKNIKVYSAATLVALFVAVLDTLAHKTVAFLPLADKGFAWLVPTVAVFILVSLVTKKEDLPITEEELKVA